MLTVGSLASGYGGLEMALGYWLGAIDMRWHAESDPDASRVLKTHWPEVPNLGDFTLPGFWEGAERVDLMCGGIPCQPFSAAGRQQGTADARYLWPDWRRGIELHRPATVVFENVANLTRGKMRPIFDGIIADLIALGYDVRWCLLGACAVGAAHHRHRVFLLACRSRTTPNAAQVTVRTCGQKLLAYLPRRSGMRMVAGDLRPMPEWDWAKSWDEILLSSLLPTPSAVSYGNNQGGAAGRTGPVRHSLDALARLELLPTTAARDGSTRGEGSEDYWRERRAEGDAAREPLGAALALLPSPRGRDGSGGPGHGANMQGGVGLPAALNVLPSPRASDGSNGGPNQGIASGDIALSSAVQPERWGRYAAAIARHADAMGALPPEPTEIGPKGGRRLAAAFSEWLMMLPTGHLTGVLDRNPALARAGNGVVPLQAATALSLLFADLVRR